jgi:hypothetical protein
MRQSSVHLLGLALLAAAIGGSGCDSDSDKVCANTGACSHGGSSDWIESCRHEADILGRQANDTGCRGQYDSYYACTADHFECHGATTSFPGCDEKNAALSQCLANAGENSACGQLAARNAACAVAADGGEAQDAGTAPPTGCDLNRECQARCFLDHVADSCAPDVDELAAYTDCAFSCPL